MVTAHNPSWSGVSSDEHYRGHWGPTTPGVFRQIHLSGSLPFSLPLNCSHTATFPPAPLNSRRAAAPGLVSPRPGYYSMSCCTRNTHNDQWRALLGHVWHLLGPPPKTKPLHHPSHLTCHHWVEPQGLSDDDGSPYRSQGHLWFSCSPQSLPSSRLM